MVRKIFKIIVLLLIVNAVYRVAPPVWRYQHFKNAAQNLALAAKGKADATIIAEVMELAAEHNVPIEREWIAIRRSPDLTHTYIDATWAEDIKAVPGWTYQWVPQITVDGWHVKPPTLKDVR
jgi:hypothetical protein